MARLKASAAEAAGSQVRTAWIRTVLGDPAVAGKISAGVAARQSGPEPDGVAVEPEEGETLRQAEGRHALARLVEVLPLLGRCIG